MSARQHPTLVRRPRLKAASSIRTMRPRIFSWLICETHDDKGNVMVYGYEARGLAGRGSAAHERTQPRNPATRRRTATSSGFVTATPPRYCPARSRRYAGQLAGHVAVRAGARLRRTRRGGGGRSPTSNDRGGGIDGPDPFSTLPRRLRVPHLPASARVLMFHHFPDDPAVGANCLVRSTDFLRACEPANDPTSNEPALPGSRCCRGGAAGLSARRRWQYTARMPPVSFRYSEPTSTDAASLTPKSSRTCPSARRATATPGSISMARATRRAERADGRLVTTSRTSATAAGPSTVVHERPALRARMRPVPHN